MEIKCVEGFDRIDAVDVFEKELLGLFKKSKTQRDEYLRFLNGVLHKIDNSEGTNDLDEIISYKGIPLHSIHKPMKKNTRVLYYYTDADRIILLTAFDEKNTASDYKKGKENAYYRLKILNLI